MDVVGTFRRNALGRQVFEGVKIRNCSAHFKLNSKEEFVQPREVTPEYNGTGTTASKKMIKLECSQRSDHSLYCLADEGSYTETSSK